MAGYRLYRHRSYDVAAAKLPAAVQRKAIWAQVLLGVRGRTPSVKSTVGLNARWRRTPVQGNHYYLWWVPAAEAEGNAASFGGAAPAILVHSIRHHDATDDALEVGAPNDYEEIPFELLDPRFDEQLAIGYRLAGVKTAELPLAFTTIKGLPGSGKSVSLLYLARDLAERPGVRKIRYVTYTERLKRAAQELVVAHGHDLAQRLTVHTVNDVVSELTGVALPTEPFSEAREFIRFLDLQRPAALGPWRRYPLTLYTEMRGWLAGRTFPPAYKLPAARHDQLRLGEGSAIDAAAYARARGLDLQLAELVVALMQRMRDTNFFLDQRAAYRALEAIQRGDYPRWLAESDAVIVDEVQDLTLLQIALIGELGRLRLRKAAATPFVMTVAGDESQIVQPSGFDWGVTKDLLAEQLGAYPQEHEFRHQRRSPPTLGHVIDNSWSFYGHLPKSLRPSARRQSFDFASEGPVAESAGDVGLVMVVQPPGLGDGQGWRDLLAELAERPGRAVVDLTLDPAAGPGDSAQAVLSGALPEDAEEVLFVPREIKGLERGTVIVRGLDQLYRRARDLCHDPDGLHIPLLEARRLFDEMRVALSRSTNRLVLVEPRDAAVFHELKLDQVHGCLHLGWRELVDFLRAEDMTEIEMIELLLDEVEDLAERARWEQAQRRNRRAHDLAVQIDDDSLRRDAEGQYVDIHFQEADHWLARHELSKALDAAGRGRTLALALGDPVVLDRMDEAWERIQDAAAQEVERLLADAATARAADRFEAAHRAARTAHDLAQIAPESSFAARAAETLAQAALDWATVLLVGDGPAPVHPPRAAELLHEAAHLVAAQGDAPGGAALALLAARYDAVPQRRDLTPDEVRSVLAFAGEYLRAAKPLAPGSEAYRLVRAWLDETFAALGDHAALYYEWAVIADRLVLDADYPALDERMWELENRLDMARRPAGGALHDPTHDPAVTRFRAFVAAYGGDPGAASRAWEELGEIELAVQQARLAGEMERAYNLLRQGRLPIAEELATAVKALRLLQQVEQKQHGLTPAERRAILEELTRLHAQLSEATPDEP